MTNSSDSSSCALTCVTHSVYIDELDRTEFLDAFLQFGIPCIVCLFLGGWAFWKAQFKFRLLPSVVSMMSLRGWLASDRTWERWLAWICLFLVLVALLPTVFIMLWGIWVYTKINEPLGFALFLLLMSFQMTAYGFWHWKVNGWRIDRLSVILFVISLLCMWSFEVWIIYLHSPYSYYMLSVVWVSYNMLPMVAVTFLVAGTMAKPVNAYLMLDADPVDDYREYLRETLAAQRVKVEQHDRLPKAVDDAVRIHLPDDRLHPHAAAAAESKEEPTFHHDVVAAPAADGGGMSASSPVILESPTASRSPLWYPIAFYLLSLGILLAYSLSVQLVKDSGGYSSVAGWVTSGAIICLDITVWLCVYGGKITSPLAACLYQAACRIILVAFGDVYWFCGHAMMYVFLSFFFGGTIVNHLMPALSAAEERTSIIDSLASSSSSGSSATDDAVSTASAVAAIRYSDQLSAGFMPKNSFAATPIGRSLMKYAEFYSIGLLTVAFLIDLIVCSQYSTVDLQFSDGRSHAQYLAGVLAIFLTALCIMARFIYRMYYNRDFRIDVRLLLACALQWAVCAGCGGFLFDRTRSVIIICCFCFLPPVVYLATYAYVEWERNDFQLWVVQEDQMLIRAPGASAADKRRRHIRSSSLLDVVENDASSSPPPVVLPGASENQSVSGEEEEKKSDAVVINVSPVLVPPPAPAPVAPRMAISEVEINLGRFNYLKKYKIGACMVLGAVLVILMGATIASNSDPPYVGYSIMAVILVLASTAMPMIEWFNSFAISRNMIVQLSFTSACFAAFLLIFWLDGLGGVDDDESLSLLFLLFIYPTCVTLLFALIKWRDDNWRMSNFVKWALIFCCAFVFTFLILVAILYDPWEIGAVLLVAFVILLFGAFVTPSLTKRYPTVQKWIALGCALVLIAFAAGVGSQPGSGFLGFSFSWCILFLCLLAMSFRAHRREAQSESLSHLFSTNIFPVFAYMRKPGIRNPLQADDKRVYLVALTLFVALIWGILAVFFLEQTAVGLFVHAFAIVLMIIYACDALLQPRLKLAKAVRYLGEGSDEYKDLVRRAKMASFRSQLCSIKVSSTSSSSTLRSNVSSSSLSSPVFMTPSPRDDNSAASPEERKEEKKMPPRTLTMAQEVTSVADPDDLLLEEEDLSLLGLDDPQRPLNELDWRGLYQTFCHLRVLTPKPSLAAAWEKQDEVSVVPWRNTTLPLRRSHELLLRLDHHISVLHVNSLAYTTQVLVEIILGVAGMKSEHEAQILAMLRETGHGKLTMEDIHTLKPVDRLTLEAALADWKRKQARLAADRERKRLEEEESTRRREEERRQRLLEQEQRIAQQRRDQQKLDEAAALRKQEELRRREAADRIQRVEDEARRLEAVRLEQARIAREQAEAVRKKHEEELAARLIAEANEQQLRELRAQQEAARIAELQRHEQEKKERERLASLQAARDAALAAEHAMQQQVAEAVKHHRCTLTVTGEKFTTQQWYRCLTCASPHDEGCCEVCRTVCHAGHDLKPMGPSPFYCDCGRTGCEGFTGVKPIDKSKPTLAQIESAYAKTGKPWTDPDFPPSTVALVRDADINKTNPSWKKIHWKRPEEIRGVKKPVIFADGANAFDIAQGGLGDCWLLSAISVLTQRQPDLLRIFVSKSHSSAGAYSVNFYHNGEVVNVIIDSHFPVNENNMPAFGRSVDPNELWVMILEKAYAKLHGSFSSLESGWVDQALMDLSGGIGSRIDMKKDPAKQQAHTGQLFSQLLQFHQSGFLLGAGSPAGSDSEANASADGIIQGHAYAILDVQEVDGNQLLRLRNPWGRAEWTGDWSDHSSKWTRRLKAKLNWVEAEDGAFWMSMVDFSRAFDEIYICRFFDADQGWKALEPIRGEWSGETAGGCTNYSSVKDNPQYLLTITEPTTIVINLAQTDARGTSQKLKPIAIEIYNARGRRVTRTKTGTLVCSNPESYIFRREVTVEHTLDPQSDPYTVLVSTYDPSEETKFTLQVFSTATIGWEAAASDATAKKKTKQIVEEPPPDTDDFIL